MGQPYDKVVLQHALRNHLSGGHGTNATQCVLEEQGDGRNVENALRPTENQRIS